VSAGILLMMAAPHAFADEADEKVYLKSGEVLEGTIRNNDWIWRKSSDYAIPPEADGHAWILIGDRIREVPWANIARIEKIIKPPKGVQLLVKPDRWGQQQFGYQTQLIPMQEAFVIGQPMRFGLVMRNARESRQIYDSQGVFQDCLLIKDAKEEKIPYSIRPPMTGGGGERLDPGDMVTLFEDRDISREYAIRKPGTYTIQFREDGYGLEGNSRFPASNVVTFDAQPNH